VDKAATIALHKRYQFENWAGTNAMELEMFVANFHLAAFLAAGWVPLRTTQSTGPDGLTAAQSIWRHEDDAALVRIDCFETRSRIAAHQQIPIVLSQFQTSNLERATATGPGDVAFEIRSDKKSESIVFARANLVLLLANAGREKVEIQKVAEILDLHICEKPTLTEEFLSRGTSPIQLEIAADQTALARTVQGGRPRFAKNSPVKFRILDECSESRTHKVFSHTEIQAENNNLVTTPIASGCCVLEVFSITDDGNVSQEKLSFDVD
jgi:hypothetical protein